MQPPIDDFIRQVQLISAQLEQLRAHGMESSLPPDLSTLLDTFALTVTALHTAEAELRQQQEQLLEAEQVALHERARYQALFEGAPDAYLVTTVFGIIQEANLAAEQLLGISVPYITGKPLTLYVTTDERRDFRTFLYNLSHSNAPERREREFTIAGRRRRNAVPVAATVAPVFGENGRLSGFRWLLRDLSQRRAVQAQLRESNQMLRLLIDASPLAIIVLDMDAHIRLWNRTAESLFGWTQSELLGEPLATIAPESLDTFWRNFFSVREGETITNTEQIHMDAHGERVPVRASMTPLYSPTYERIGVLTLCNDLREEYQYREELREVRNRLYLARDSERRRLAQELHDGAIQQLVGLQFQLAYLHSKKQASPEANSVNGELGLNDISAELGGVVRLLRSLTNEMNPPGLEAFGLEQALDSLRTHLQHSWMPPAPQIETTLPDEQVELPPAAANLLWRAAQEGLRNTRRHAAAQKVHVKLEATLESITLSIEDDGTGFVVPPALSAFVHDKCFGLLQLLEEAESLGGSLDISSEPGGGTQLRVTLPRELTKSAEENAA